MLNYTNIAKMLTDLRHCKIKNNLDIDLLDDGTDTGVWVFKTELNKWMISLEDIQKSLLKIDLENPTTSDIIRFYLTPDGQQKLLKWLNS